MLRLLFGLLFFGGCAEGQTLLINNVNVVDVERQTVLSGQDVLAVKGKIAWVGTGRKYKLDSSATVIDGSGKYLMPGFCDAHVHFFQSGGLYARPDVIDVRKFRPYEDEIRWTHEHMHEFLKAYVEAGVTSVIDVGSTYHFLQQRSTFENDTNSPSIYMTGPLLTTYVPAEYERLGDDVPFTKMVSVQNTIAAVHDQIRHGSDFIKIWYIVTDTDTERGARTNLPLVQAAIAEAHKKNMRVAVHATERITAQLAVEAGADYLVHDVEDEVVSDSFVRLLKEKNVVLCPTLVVGGNYNKVLSGTYRFSDDELARDNAAQVKTIREYPLPDTITGQRFMRLFASARLVQRQKTTDSICAINLKKLADGGVIIASGTDAGNIGTQHVGSYFNELEAMQKAGLTMWQLIAGCTINGARAVGMQQKWGSISVGKQANMLLFETNPTEDLSGWKHPETVINKGVAIHR